MMLAALALLSCFSLPQQSPPVEWRAVGPFRDRIQPGVVYDERRKRLVLFGGGAYGGGWKPNDMHEWDGKRWHRRRPKHMPVPNRGVSGMMAWDPVRKTAIHFGGMALDGKTILNETWEYNGRDWKKLSPKTVPPKRFTQSMFHDPVRKQILMFGGANSLGRWTGGPLFGLLNDTWVWDGKDWKQMFPKFKPKPRRGGGLTYWKRTGQMVLYNGVNLANFPVDSRNLYTWDGTNWTQIPLKTSPTPGAGLLVPDPWTGDVLHLDPVGQIDPKTGNRVRHFWRWDGKTFSKFGPAQPKEMTGDWQPHLFPPTKQIYITGWYSDRRPGKLGEDRRTTVFDGKSWKVVERRPVVQGTFVNVAYDPIRKGVLVYTLKNLWPTVLNELHWFRPEGYWEKAPMTGLPSRYCYPPGMAFHPKMGKFLLWEGALCGSAIREPVYTYDRKKFEMLKGANPDGPRDSRRLTWDSQHQELLGMTAQAPGRLMVFDEKKGWMEKQPSRGDKNWGGGWAMTYDSVRKVAVIYGGEVFKGWTRIRSGELWEFDGKAWKQPTAKVKPPARIRGLLKYVPALGGVVLFGGMSLVGSNEPFMDTWLWDGKVWKELKTSEHYAGNTNTWQGRNGAGTWPKAVAYDSDSQRLIAFHRLGDYASPEIFEFRVRTLETSQNYPRPGESFWFDVHLPSQAGNPFLFLFSGGPGPSIPLRLNAAGQTERLPLALDNLLMFSLSGATALGLDGSGKGKIPFRIPNDKNLILFPFYAAGLTFDPKKNAVGRITNRIKLEVSW